MKSKKILKKKGRTIDFEALKEVRDLLGEIPRRRDLLIESLHLIQDKYYSLSEKHLFALAFEMKMAPAEVYEVATFYHHFDVIKESANTVLGNSKPPSLTIRVCNSISCEMSGSKNLLESLKKSSIAIPDSGENVRIQSVPCIGRCQHAPVAVVGKNPVDCASYELIRKKIQQKSIFPEIPKNIDFEKYRLSGGYNLFQECILSKKTAEEVINELKNSGLRGLGGAGFPAGNKWEIVKNFSAPRFLAVNIDEGEPGTFKDRHFLETDPHRFLEGSLIAAWAVEIDEIYLYIRDEYAAGYEILKREIKRLEDHFKNKLCKIHLRRGAGAYICGEESAMIESIEGKRGIPRLRPPYVAKVGLFGRPTLEHNMETLHWVRDIVEKGSELFSSNGRRGRKGLRSFSVSGRVKKPGVYIAPAGISINELIREYCDGMMSGHKFYGFFPGGASGGILPASLGDVPLDFDTLQEYGCFIGSAAVIVFSNHDSAKNLALNAMRFFEHESCGQCTPCRSGTTKAIPLMQKDKWDHNLLEDLACTMEDASICGLGQAAPNPLRSIIKFFPHEVK